MICLLVSAEGRLGSTKIGNKMIKKNLIFTIGLAASISLLGCASTSISDSEMKTAVKFNSAEFYQIIKNVPKQNAIDDQSLGLDSYFSSNSNIYKVSTSFGEYDKYFNAFTLNDVFYKEQNITLSNYLASNDYGNEVTVNQVNYNGDKLSLFGTLIEVKPDFAKIIINKNVDVYFSLEKEYMKYSTLCSEVDLIKKVNFKSPYQGVFSGCSVGANIIAVYVDGVNYPLNRLTYPAMLDEMQRHKVIVDYIQQVKDK